MQQVSKFCSCNAHVNEYVQLKSLGFIYTFRNGNLIGFISTDENMHKLMYLSILLLAVRMWVLFSGNSSHNY